MNLQLHKISCFTCRYYRMWDKSSECLLLGRTLSLTGDITDDRARFCEGWKRRPKAWKYYCKLNPFWDDEYISRESQIRIRKRLKIRI